LEVAAGFVAVAGFVVVGVAGFDSPFGFASAGNGALVSDTNSPTVMFCKSLIAS